MWDTPAHWRESASRELFVAIREEPMWRTLGSVAAHTHEAPRFTASWFQASRKKSCALLGDVLRKCGTCIGAHSVKPESKMTILPPQQTQLLWFAPGTAISLEKMHPFLNKSMAQKLWCAPDMNMCFPCFYAKWQCSRDVHFRHINLGENGNLDFVVQRSRVTAVFVG